jgi:hypothetical protein
MEETMHRLVHGLLLAGAASLLLTVPVTANAGGTSAIPLNAGQEASKVLGGGSGFFTYTIDGTEFCYTLEVFDLSGTPVAAHVHLAPRGVAGPVVIPLTAPSASTSSVSACTSASAELLSAIAANPGAYYVNVHTALYPAGEVRGQLK